MSASTLISVLLLCLLLPATLSVECGVRSAECRVWSHRPQCGVWSVPPLQSIQKTYETYKQILSPSFFPSDGTLDIPSSEFRGAKELDVTCDGIRADT